MAETKGDAEMNEGLQWTENKGFPVDFERLLSLRGVKKGGRGNWTQLATSIWGEKPWFQRARVGWRFHT